MVGFEWTETVLRDDNKDDYDAAFCTYATTDADTKSSSLVVEGKGSNNTDDIEDGMLLHNMR